MSNLTLSAMRGAMDHNSMLMFYATSTPGDHATIFYGDPGGGKTAAAWGVAQKLGCDEEHFLRWSVGQMDVPDFNGYATPRADGLHFECPARIRTLCDGNPAMFVLDEIGNADRPIQAAMLRPFDSRFIGETRIPNSCRIVGFLNPPEATTDIQDLAYPLMNRAVWVPWDRVTDEEHVAYMMSHRDARANITIPEWTGDEAYWRAFDETVAIYATYKVKLGLGSLWEDANSDQIKARWPMVGASPRSWDLFLRLAATCRAYKDTVAMRIFGKGTIGEPETKMFMNFYETADLMPADELVADVRGPKTWRPDPLRTDRTFAQLTVVATWATSSSAGLTPKALLERWHAAWDVIAWALECGEGEDVALLAAQALFAGKPKGDVLVSHEATILRFRPLTLATALFND